MLTMTKVSSPESDGGVKKEKLKFPIILIKNRAADQLALALAKREKVMMSNCR
jgi:hypothetical protein